MAINFFEEGGLLNFYKAGGSVGANYASTHPEPVDDFAGGGSVAKETEYVGWIHFASKATAPVKGASGKVEDVPVYGGNLLYSVTAKDKKDAEKKVMERFKKEEQLVSNEKEYVITLKGIETDKDYRAGIWKKEAGGNVNTILDYYNLSKYDKDTVRAIRGVNNSYLNLEGLQIKLRALVKRDGMLSKGMYGMLKADIERLGGKMPEGVIVSSQLKDGGDVGNGLKVETENDLVEVAKYMVKAVQKGWDLKDLMHYFEEDNGFDYKVRVKVWDDMNMYEARKNYDNIFKLLKAIVEGNGKTLVKLADGGAVDIEEGIAEAKDLAILDAWSKYAKKHDKDEDDIDDFNAYLNKEHASLGGKQKQKAIREFQVTHPEPVDDFEAGGSVRSPKEYNKLVDQKQKLVENLSPKEVAEMWNANSHAVKDGISKPWTESQGKLDYAKMYLRNLLIENELTEAEYMKYFATGGAVDDFAGGEKGGDIGADRMYNFLKDDWGKFEKAVNEGDKEEVDRFFSYWIGSNGNGHLKSLKTTANDRMYNFLKDDLEKLEKAVNEGDKEEIDRFFSYWGYHLKSLKMAEGGAVQPDTLVEAIGVLSAWETYAKRHDKDIDDIDDFNAYLNKEHASLSSKKKQAAIKEFAQIYKENEEFATGGELSSLKVENENDLVEVAKYMVKAVKKHWDLKDLIHYFEEANGFDYKVRVKVWDSMNMYDARKNYDNIFKLLKAIVDGNGKHLEAVEKYVAVHENKDGYWTIASKPVDSKKIAEILAAGAPRGETGKVVTLKEAKEHKKVLGREYLEMAEGGTVGKIYTINVPVDDENPQGEKKKVDVKLTGNKDGKKLWAESIDGKSVYLVDEDELENPNFLVGIGSEILISSYGHDRNVKMKLIEVTPLTDNDIKDGLGRRSYHFVGSKNRSQWYPEAMLQKKMDAGEINFTKKMADGGKVSEKDFNESMGYYDSIIRQVKSALQKSSRSEEYEKNITFLTKENVKKLVAAGYDSLDIMYIVIGYASVEEGYRPSGIIVQDTAEGFNEALEEYVEMGKKNCFEIGLKGPKFNWNDVVKKYHISLEPNVFTHNKGDYEYKYETFVGNKIVIGHALGYREKAFTKGRKWSEWNNTADSCKDGQFNGGYWGIVSSDKNIILDVVHILFKQSGGDYKSFDLYKNGLGGIGSVELLEQGIKFASGGTVKPIAPTEHYRYLDITKYPNGLELAINDEGREEVKEWQEDEKGDYEIMGELFDTVQGNSEYMWHENLGDQGFGLTSAPGITDGYYYDDDSKFTDKGQEDSAELYSFMGYEIHSPLELLLRDGKVFFARAPKEGDVLDEKGVPVKKTKKGKGKKHETGGSAGGRKNLNDLSQDIFGLEYESLNLDQQQEVKDEMKARLELYPNEYVEVGDDDEKEVKGLVLKNITKNKYVETEKNGKVILTKNIKEALMFWKDGDESESDAEATLALLNEQHKDSYSLIETDDVQ